jgi:hypothetical protein
MRTSFDFATRSRRVQASWPQARVPVGTLFALGLAESGINIPETEAFNSRDRQGVRRRSIDSSTRSRCTGPPFAATL